MKRLLLTLILGMFFISLISASDLGTFKQSDCVELYQYCDDCTYINVTSVKFPNSSISYVSSAMTKTNSDFNYTFCETSTLGDYSYTTCGNKGGAYVCENIKFKVTANGKEEAEGIVIVLFSVIFLVLLLYLIIFLFLGIGHFKDLDFDIRDLAFNLGGYFALFGFYMLELEYLGNVKMEGIILLFIEIGALTNFFLPLIGFIISYFKQNTVKGDHN